MAIAPDKTTVIEIRDLDARAAAKLLGANTHNRHLRPTVVNRYARDMAGGLWMMNGETIKVADSGVILDGQHRLAAIVQADVVIPMVVVTGLLEDSQETVDRGMPRNIADALKLRGASNATALAGAIAQAICLQSESPSDTTAWPSTREALAYYETHPGLDRSVSLGERVRSSVIRYPSTTAGALHHIFAMLDEEDADVFWERLVDGVELADDSPVLRLREFMFRELTAQRRVERPRLQVFTIKAWNAWRRGEPMLLLKWRVGGAKPEGFPRPE